MKRTFLLLVILSSFFYSCKTKSEIAINDNLLKEISQENQSLPSQYSSFILFCRCQNGNLSIINTHTLRELYKKASIKNDYHSFIKELLDQKIKLECSTQAEWISIDPLIMNQYEKMSFRKFLFTYCEKKSKNKYFLKDDIPDNQVKSILYFLFINNYFSSEGDYIPGYFIIKM